MNSFRHHTERHRTDRIGWLRAAVLGANDGIASTASLLVGVAAANASHANLVVTGIAALVAGAMSMAAGEYVSVHSQADTEMADLSRERAELEKNPAAEQRELTAIYVARGLDVELDGQVAEQLVGARRLGRSCARRTRHFRSAQCAADPGRIGVGGQFRSRRALAIGGYCIGTRIVSDHLHFGRVASLSGLPGCHRSPGRRRQRARRRLARHLVGRSGHGHHGRRGRLVRRGGLMSGRAIC